MNLLKYLLVKWKSNSYTLQSFHKIGRYVIKVAELVCNSVYFIPVDNIKQWYTSNEKKNKSNFQVEYCYFNY